MFDRSSYLSLECNPLKIKTLLLCNDFLIPILRVNLSFSFRVEGQVAGIRICLLNVSMYLN